MTEHPITTSLSDLPKQIASLPPATIATKAKEYAINASIAGLFALLRWGYRKGTFTPTKYTIPIYATTGLTVGYFLYKYKQEAQTIISKVQEGLTATSA